MKRGKKKIVLSNKLLYLLIGLGIILVVAGCVYAVDTTQAWHSANQIDFASSTMTPSRLLAGSTLGTSADQNYYDLAGRHISALESIYSYGKICVGNSEGNCLGTGGVLITSSGITGNTVTATQLCFPTKTGGTSCKVGWGTGYVIKQTTATAETVNAICPSGKVVGGGCNCVTQYVRIAAPIPDGTGFTCTCSLSGSHTAYAICEDIQ